MSSGQRQKAANQKASGHNHRLKFKSSSPLFRNEERGIKTRSEMNGSRIGGNAAKRPGEVEMKGSELSCGKEEKLESNETNTGGERIGPLKKECPKRTWKEKKTIEKINYSEVNERSTFAKKSQSPFKS
ncbi:hypothetical protein RUM43_003949 [Polyplax serrata]|uniref:Uncharacterized protein n=1 Tax=Polyplax serrata TaxID=468196 RepID=A0AAN8P7D6_POLSC